MNRIDVLFEGYSYPDATNPKILKANCTCTLIRTSNNRNIIVDTRTAWDGSEILAALDKHGLKADNIDVVVCTHGHSDHIGCNYLFQRAEYHFVGRCASHRDNYTIDWDEEFFPLDGENVTVHHTPGHTLSCVSVLVQNTILGVVGITGDLFENEKDIDDETVWLNAGSENVKTQKMNRSRIAEQCDYIIPGHGAGFTVTQDIRNKLKMDSSNLF